MSNSKLLLAFPNDDVTRLVLRYLSTRKLFALYENSESGRILLDKPFFMNMVKKGDVSEDDYIWMIEKRFTATFESMKNYAGVWVNKLLVVAVTMNDKVIVEELLKKGANVESFSNYGGSHSNSIQAAIKNKNHDMVKFLLEWNGQATKLIKKESLELLVIATQVDDYEMCEYLISKDASIGIRELRAAVRCGSNKLLKLLLSKMTDNEQFHYRTSLVLQDAV
jgi:hypothetical protein